MLQLEATDAELDALSVDDKAIEGTIKRARKKKIDFAEIDDELGRLTTLVAGSMDSPAVNDRPSVEISVSDRPSVELFEEPMEDLSDLPTTDAPVAVAEPPSFTASVDGALDDLFADETVSEPPAEAIEIAPSSSIAAPVKDPFADEDGTLVLDGVELEEFDGEVLAEAEGVIIEEDVAVGAASASPEETDLELDLDFDAPSSSSSPALAEPTAESADASADDNEDGEKPKKGFFKKMFGSKKK